MSSSHGELSFDNLLEAIKNFRPDDLLPIQKSVRDLLANSQFTDTQASPPNIDMRYFELLKSPGAREQNIPTHTLLQAIGDLNYEHLFLLDIMLIFLLHKKNLAEALPDINKRAKREVRISPRIAEVLYPTYVMPAKSPGKDKKY